MLLNSKISPKLPVLEIMIKIINSTGKLDLEKVAIIGVQHMLFTTVSLLEALIKLGIGADNIYLTGKSYSTCSEVTDYLCSLDIQYQRPLPQTKLGDFSGNFKLNMEQLWNRFLNDLPRKKFTALLILDDGAGCLSTFPKGVQLQLPVIGVEQTTYGIKNPEIRTLPFPIIEVASSAVKQYLESPMIAEAVINKLNSIFPFINYKMRCGVAGLGVIGQAVAKKLLSLGFKVITYDISDEKNIAIENAASVSSTQELIVSSDYIFGCAGEDITRGLSFPETLKTKKYFISCSSKDIEFLSLLKYISSYIKKTNINTLDDIEYKEKNIDIKIFKGGFPINLDSSGESVPEHNIQMTRALLFGGVIQGILNLSENTEDNKNNRHMLDPNLQKFIVSCWLPYGNQSMYSKDLIAKFTDPTWIKNNSGGFYYPCNYIKKHFFIENLLSEASNY